ncbi:hypothetical protein JCM19992_26930 [Thermostilla marina]
MSVCRFSAIILATVVLFICGSAARFATAADKPNIVYIVSDELGYYELSCMGHPHFKTPNIDRMAAEGIRFTQALAGAPVCAPTRCTLLTGKHMGHASVRNNPGGTPIRAEEVTIGSMLKQVGYATGGFGKWGIGGRGSTGVPEKHGFDIFFGYYDQVHAHSYYTPYLLCNSKEVPLPGNHGLSVGETYSHYVIWEQAKKFIRENHDRPFFCYLPITPPHGIHDIPETDPSWQLYKDKPWPHEAKVYAAMVNMVDRNVGELLAMLKELGIEDKTLVFLTGDNGAAPYFADAQHPRGFHAGNVNPITGVEFRGGKGNLYEGGLRVPAVARWPGHIEPGRVSDLLWYFPDIMPTIAELVGVEPPKDIDGISILPELIGEDEAGHAQQQHEFLYWEYGKQRAVRMGNWKAIQPGTNAEWELYDLSKDISETTNVAAEHPDILAKMIAYAEASSVPAEPGTFLQPELNEKDRQAKFGDQKGQPKSKVKTDLPREGLVPYRQMKIVSVSSESKHNGHLAIHAIDGDPATWWHSEFAPELHGHPHELVIDMGKRYVVRGIAYLARQDSGFNGTIAECEVFVADSTDFDGIEPAKVTFKQTKKPQSAEFSPRTGRYVRIRTLSEVGGHPWASAAEIGIVGEPAEE